jgi:hypothetical protein
VPDQTETEAPPAPPTLSSEIGASLASVWARYVGLRPVGAETVIDGNVVRWTLSDGAGKLDASIAASADDPDADAPKRIGTFKRDIGAAVARTTHRRVTAQISKQDTKTGTATETFILEGPHRKN